LFLQQTTPHTLRVRSIVGILCKRVKAPLQP